MLLLVLGHVDADHGPLVVEQKLGQRPRQLGLANSGRPQENETADGAVGVLKPGARAQHGLGHRCHGFVLAHHPLVQLFFEVQQLAQLAFEQLRDRNAGPAAHHFGDVFLVHFLFKQPRRAVLA